ncbi:MAG TPA: homoserine dehydrogenase, partial [Anaerolineae bacterium]|nr:homoserine dehydrogenase [Anaerolineae bacterium]
MTHYNLVMIGFGNVGKAFAKLLLRKKDQIAEQYQITTSVTAIATANHGAAIDL